MSTNPPSVNEEKLAQYLLGELSEAERVEVEDTCLADEAYYEQLLAIEAELIDDYVRGTLTGPQREHFEERLKNTPAWRDELKLARNITGIEPTERTRSGDGSASWSTSRFSWANLGRAAQISLAAAALLLVCLAVWVLWSTRERNPTDPQIARDESRAVSSPTPEPSITGNQANEKQPDAPAPAPTQVKPPVSPAPTVITLALVSSFERSAGGANDLVIPRRAEKVRLQLIVGEDGYQSYTATLRSVEGREILTRRNIKSTSAGRGQTITLEFASDSLPEGDFILTLSGATPQRQTEDINKYFLSIRKTR